MAAVVATVRDDAIAVLSSYEDYRYVVRTPPDGRTGESQVIALRSSESSIVGFSSGWVAEISTRFQRLSLSRVFVRDMVASFDEAAVWVLLESEGGPDSVNVTVGTGVFAVSFVPQVTIQLGFGTVLYESCAGTFGAECQTDPSIVRRTPVNSVQDVLLLKLNATNGTPLLMAAVGGSQRERPRSLAVGDGWVAASGVTESTDFPVFFNGTDSTNPATVLRDADAFIFAISSNGTDLLFSQRYGGSRTESVGAIDVDKSSGLIALAGHTLSDDILTTPGAITPGKPSPITIESWFVYVVASPGLNASVLPTGIAAQVGSGIVPGSAMYATYYGGNQPDLMADVSYIGGAIFAAGNVLSQNLVRSRWPSSIAGGREPHGEEDMFVMWFEPDLGATVAPPIPPDPIMAAYVGGSVIDEVRGLCKAESSSFSGPGSALLPVVALVGRSSSSDYPLVRATQPCKPGDPANAVVTTLALRRGVNASFMAFSTFLGGSGAFESDKLSEAAWSCEFGPISSSQVVLKELAVAGSTTSRDFPKAAAVLGAPGLLEGFVGVYTDPLLTLPTVESGCDALQPAGVGGRSGGDGDGLSGGAIAGVVLGMAAVCALVGVAVFVWYQSRDRDERRTLQSQVAGMERQLEELGIQPASSSSGTEPTGTRTNVSAGGVVGGATPSSAMPVTITGTSVTAQMAVSGAHVSLGSVARTLPAAETSSGGGGGGGGERGGVGGVSSDSDVAAVGAVVSQWAIGPNDVALTRKVGSGGFGVVYLGEWRGVAVAVKRLLSAPGETELQVFQSEITLLARLRHPNIVQFLGACLDPQNTFIVTEFVERGDLRQVMQSFKLTWLRKVRIARDCAQGLHYLHCERVVHRDIKSGNVLIGQNFDAKLTDFGLSKTVIEDQTMTHSKLGTLPWLAPELVQGRAPSYHSDVWAFGMLLYELLTGKYPYEGFPAASVVRNIDCGILPSLPDEMDDDYEALLHDCWQPRPSDRPTMEEVCDRIKWILYQTEKAVVAEKLERKRRKKQLRSRSKELPDAEQQHAVAERRRRRAERRKQRAMQQLEMEGHTDPSSSSEAQAAAASASAAAAAGLVSASSGDEDEDDKDGDHAGGAATAPEEDIDRDQDEPPGKARRARRSRRTGRRRKGGQHNNNNRKDHHRDHASDGTGKLAKTMTSDPDPSGVAVAKPGDETPRYVARPVASAHADDMIVFGMSFGDLLGELDVKRTTDAVSKHREKEVRAAEEALREVRGRHTGDDAVGGSSSKGAADGKAGKRSKTGKVRGSLMRVRSRKRAASGVSGSESASSPADAGRPSRLPVSREPGVSEEGDSRTASLPPPSGATGSSSGAAGGTCHADLPDASVRPAPAAAIEPEEQEQEPAPATTTASASRPKRHGKRKKERKK